MIRFIFNGQVVAAGLRTYCNVKFHKSESSQTGSTITIDKTNYGRECFVLGDPNGFFSTSDSVLKRLSVSK